MVFFEENWIRMKTEMRVYNYHTCAYIISMSGLCICAGACMPRTALFHNIHTNGLYQCSLVAYQRSFARLRMYFLLVKLTTAVYTHAYICTYRHALLVTDMEVTYAGLRMFFLWSKLPRALCTLCIWYLRRGAYLCMYVCMYVHV